MNGLTSKQRKSSSYFRSSVDHTLNAFLAVNARVALRRKACASIFGGRFGGVALESNVQESSDRPTTSLKRQLLGASYMCKHANFLRRLIASQLRKDKDLACEGLSRTMFVHTERSRAARLFEGLSEQNLQKIAPVRVIFTRTQNSMFASATNTVTGNTYISLASGSTGLQGKKRTSPVAAEALGEYFAQRFLTADEKVKDVLNTSVAYGYKAQGNEEKIPVDFYTKLGYLDSFSKSFMKGVSKITKRVLLKDELSSRNIVKNRAISFVNILLDGKLSHNGVRKPKKRRV